MALLQIIKLRDFPFELDKVLPAMIMKRNFCKDRNVVAKLAQVYVRFLAFNIASFFQSFNPLQTGACRQSHRIGQIDICNPAI